MKKSFIFVLSFLILIPCFPQTESITITTYYPAPFGVYQNLRLFPTTTEPACNEGNEGTMYYDNTINQLRVCRETALGVYGMVAASSNWTHPAGTEILHVNDIDWDVGIGTNAPGGKLEVLANTGAITISPRNNNNVIGFYDSTRAHTARIVKCEGGAPGMECDPDKGLYIQTANSRKIYLTGMANVAPHPDVIIKGNVGIGTTNPQGKLDVQGGIVYVERLVVRKRAGNPPSPQEGEIWLIQ